MTQNSSGVGAEFEGMWFADYLCLHWANGVSYCLIKYNGRIPVAFERTTLSAFVLCKTLYKSKE